MDVIKTLIEMSKKILAKEKELSVKKDEENIDNQTAKVIDGKISETLGDDDFNYLDSDGLHHILSGGDSNWSPIHIHTQKEDKKRNYYFVNKSNGKVICVTGTAPKREVERRFSIDKAATDSLNKLIHRIELQPEKAPPSDPVLSKEELDKAEAPKMKRIQLPIGTQIDMGAQADRMMGGKIKILHADGKTGWVQVRAGKIQSRYVPDTPVPVLNPRAQ
jgi:hypothetical protein